MDAIDALEAELATDPYGPLREHLAVNDDHMLESLVALRKAKHLTQDEVADRMNRSKTAVSNFERLGSDPHLSTIRRYAAAVGGRLITKVVDYDIERTEADMTECLSVMFPKVSGPVRAPRGPVGQWEIV